MIGVMVVLLQIIDRTSGDTWASNNNVRNSSQYLGSYSIISVTSLAIQILLLLASARIAFTIKKVTSRPVIIIKYVYLVSHLTIIALIAFLLGEQLLTYSYHLVLSKLILGLSLIISALMLLSLAFTSLKSYLASRNKMAGVYGFAIIALSVQLISAFFYTEVNLYNKSEYITPNRNPWASYFYTSLQSKLFSIYEVSKALSFIAVWIASILLTKQYAHKTGKIKYWTTVSIPVTYFLFQYSPLLFSQTGILSSLLMAKGSIFLYSYNFVLNTANVGSGILFGLSFFIVSRSLVYDHLKYYLIICGTGIMIIFSSSISTILILAPFPSWSIVSLSFILPASFLILIGLDSASYYIASDISVRRFLYRYRNQYELFGALGSTEATAAVERKVHHISKQIADISNIETLFKPAAESEDIKKYVMEVIAEMKKSDFRSDNSK